MLTVGSKLVKVIAALLVTGAIPAWAQTVVLKGKVMNAVPPSPIAAADVIIVGSDGKVLQTIVTGADGSYSVSGLKHGEKVTAKYRKLGYSPDPRMYPVALAQAQTIQNATLYSNSATADDWEQWSKHQKAFVVSQTAAPAQQANIYYMIWSDLSKFQVSPEAQARAAKQIVTVAPNLSHSPHLLSFASVKIGAVDVCTAKIEAAIEGSAQLSLCKETPPDVAAEIAASEVRKQSLSPGSEERFLIEYRNLWGVESSKQLHKKLTGDWVIMGNQDWELQLENKETPLERKPKEISQIPSPAVVPR